MAGPKIFRSNLLSCKHSVNSAARSGFGIVEQHIHASYMTKMEPEGKSRLCNPFQVVAIHGYVDIACQAGFPSFVLRGYANG